MSLQTRLGSLITAIGADIKALQNGDGAPALVSALPTVGPSGSGALVDGQICHYQNAAMAALGIVWTFRYRSGSGSSSKWEFIGGPPLFHEILPYEGRNSNAFGGLTTAGPTLTVPLAGDYMVAVEAELGANSGTCAAVMSYTVDAAAASENDHVYGGTTFTSPSTGWNARHVRRRTFAAGAVLLAVYRSTVNTVNAGFSNRSLTLTPVRVG